MMFWALVKETSSHQQLGLALVHQPLDCRWGQVGGRMRKMRQGNGVLRYTGPSSLHQYSGRCSHLPRYGGGGTTRKTLVAETKRQRQEPEKGHPVLCSSAQRPTSPLPRLVPPARDDPQHRETPAGSDAAPHELPARSEITHRGFATRRQITFSSGPANLCHPRPKITLPPSFHSRFFKARLIDFGMLQQLKYRAPGTVR